MEGYNQNRAADVEEYPSLPDLLAAWELTAEALEGAMASVTEERLAAPAGPGGVHGEQSLAHWLTFMVWHEANHFGAIGMIRPQLGYPTISEMAQKAAEAASAG